MSTCVITMSDADDGKVDVHVSFDPPVDNADMASYSPAQIQALTILQSLMDDVDAAEVTQSL